MLGRNGKCTCWNFTILDMSFFLCLCECIVSLFCFCFCLFLFRKIEFVLRVWDWDCVGLIDREFKVGGDLQGVSSDRQVNTQHAALQVRVR